jgi:high-affinity Fe2+/Pb2+ permease
MMIKLNSNTLVYAFLATALAYMGHVAESLQHFLIMLFIAFAVPAFLMAVTLASNKREERKRDANYYIEGEEHGRATRGRTID